MKFFKKDKGVVFREIMRYLRCFLFLNSLFLLDLQIEIYLGRFPFNIFFVIFDFSLLCACITKFIHYKYKSPVFKKYYIISFEIFLLLSLLGTFIYWPHIFEYYNTSRIDANM